MGDIEEPKRDSKSLLCFMEQIQEDQESDLFPQVIWKTLRLSNPNGMFIPHGNILFFWLKKDWIISMKVP